MGLRKHAPLLQIVSTFVYERLNDRNYLTATLTDAEPAQDQIWSALDNYEFSFEQSKCGLKNDD